MVLCTRRTSRTDRGLLLSDVFSELRNVPGCLLIKLVTRFRLRSISNIVKTKRNNNKKKKNSSIVFLSLPSLVFFLIAR